MQNWFETKCCYRKIDENGRERKVTELYLLDAVSFTDAEARITKEMQERVRGGEFEVTGVNPSKITEVIAQEEGQWWYKARISLVTIDEIKGKEVKVNQYFLVNADSFKDALLRLEEGLSYILVPFEIISLQVTPICDVFPYFSDDVESTPSQPTATETSND